MFCRDRWRFGQFSRGNAGGLAGVGWWCVLLVRNSISEIGCEAIVMISIDAVAPSVSEGGSYTVKASGKGTNLGSRQAELLVVLSEVIKNTRGKKINEQETS